MRTSSVRLFAPRAIASRASQSSRRVPILFPVPPRIDGDGRDVAVVERHHQARVPHELATDARDEVRARRAQRELGQEQRRAPRARVHLLLDPQHRAQVPAPHRRVTLTASTSGSAAIIRGLPRRRSAVPGDLGVALAKVHRMHVPPAARTPPARPGRWPAPRARAALGHANSGPASSTWSSAANSLRKRATPSPASSTSSSGPAEVGDQLGGRAAPRTRRPVARRRAPGRYRAWNTSRRRASSTITIIRWLCRSG